ncbi:MAG: co-chaperone GroES [Alphaproteobacteria bacterium]|nr:co-chaperone GroES [Alphaproteobacteria bacterium]
MFMFKPLHNYVLLERIEEENITAGGIIIPDNAKEKPSRGRVIATGNGTYNGDDLIPMSVKAGDVVLFAKWAASANEVKIDGHDYVLIKETDILGILE